MSNVLYSRADLKLRQILSEIETGSIGLPDLQRPFVWPDKKVRDLLDSMMKGYPIGFIITWENANSSEGTKQIGELEHSYKIPNKLIIDGQQRLTSLFAVFKKIKVYTADFTYRNIVISYNPFTNVFDVANSAYEKSADWVYNISDVFTQETYPAFNAYINRLQEARAKKGLEVSEDEKTLIYKRFTELKSLEDYMIPTLNIDKEADEEDVSNIFVTINSGGTHLNESDFILTLISVNWPEGREEIEKFCKDTKIPQPIEAGLTAYTPLVNFETSDIIRSIMAFGFRRARLKYCYKLLRGADFDNKGVISEELKVQRFDEFKKALDLTTNPKNWQEFIKCIISAGFVTADLLSSNINVAYAYAFYLIGKFDYDMKEDELRKVITKWFFAISLTSRYVGSFEGQMETDMSGLEGVHNSEEFENYFNSLMASRLTDDYFNITLTGPDGLESTATRNPAWLCYCASLSVLNAKVLFSKTDLGVSQLFSEYSKGMRKSLEKHHLFPKAYLKSIGFTPRLINQEANYAFIEWPDNMDILDVSPAQYFPDQKKVMNEDQLKALSIHHALPDNWENMTYETFLAERRKLMAKVIKAGYDRILKF